MSQRAGDRAGGGRGAGATPPAARRDRSRKRHSRTDENVYLLSIVTALVMPATATLVTGSFGMNTGGMPFAHGWHGTLLASFVAIGLVRR